MPYEISKAYVSYYTHAEAAPRPGLITLTKLDTAINRFLAFVALGYASGDVSRTARLTARMLLLLPPLKERAAASVMFLNGAARGRLLDIGCGNGSFLIRMRELGWEVTGVEPDLHAAEIARNKLGSTVITSTFEDAELAEDYFDALTASHVLEHVVDPIAFLLKCRKVMKTNGKLVIRTPNLSSLGHRIFGRAWAGLEHPRHLHIFTPAALAECVERANLKVEYLSTTAQLAFLSWEASWLLTRKRSWVGTKASAPLVLSGLLFQVIEEVALSLNNKLGEEIVLIATKL